jgi:hypothetical protein
MDITGGTSSSGGCFSPAAKRSDKILVYDPRHHRWQKNQVAHAKNPSAPMFALNSKYGQVKIPWCLYFL